MADKFEVWWDRVTLKTVTVLAGMIMALCAFMFNQGMNYLEKISNSLELLTKEVVAIKLSDSANNVRITRIEEDLFNFRNTLHEDSKRIGRLERKQTEHSQMLKEK